MTPTPMTAPTPNAPAGEREGDATRLAAQFAAHDADMDLLRWTYELLGVTSTTDDPLTFARRALREARAELLAARREVEAARVALNGIADHGWCYDGRVTFTINCVGMGDAKRLEALLFAASPARSDND